MFRVDVLEGIKIVDVSRIFTGPYATQILGDMGATIVKVEPPQGDDTRKWGPPFLDDDISSYFATLNRNKMSITLNLKDQKDREILKKLVQWCDVFIHNYRPGVDKKLGIDVKSIWSINPRVIYVSMSMFGDAGPFKEHGGYDIIAQAATGIMSVTGCENGEVTKVGIPIGDIATGMYATIGILAALWQRNRTGKGIEVKTSLFESLLSWLTYQAANAFITGENPKPLGTKHPNIVPYQVFACQNNGQIAIAIGNEKHWRLLCQTIHAMDLLEDKRFQTNADRVKNREELISRLRAVFLQRPQEYWERVLREKGIAVTKVYGLLDVFEHPQVKALNAVEFVHYDNQGIKRSVPLFRLPLRFSGVNEKPWTPPPHEDEYRQEVLELLENTGTEKSKRTIKNRGEKK